MSDAQSAIKSALQTLQQAPESDLLATRNEILIVFDALLRKFQLPTDLLTAPPTSLPTGPPFGSHINPPSRSHISPPSTSQINPSSRFHANPPTGSYTGCPTSPPTGPYTGPHTGPSTSLCGHFLDSLVRYSERVGKLKENNIAECIGQSFTAHADIRLQHITAIEPSTTTDTSIIRGLFAYRSLGLEFEDFLAEQKLPSRIEELVRESKNSQSEGHDGNANPLRKFHGNISKFVKHKNWGKDNRANRAIQFAIRILAVESMFQSPGISKLLIFTATKLRRFPLYYLHDAIELLRSKYPQLSEQANSSQHYVTNGQLYYNYIKKQSESSQLRPYVQLPSNRITKSRSTKSTKPKERTIGRSK
ncbi:hypothetical protein FQN57_003991, partial [Myotisia sp. PD_48]